MSTFQEIIQAGENHDFGEERIECDTWRLLNQMKTNAGGIVMLILVDRKSALIFMQSKYAIQIRLGAFSPPSRILVPKAIRVMLGEQEDEPRRCEPEPQMNPEEEEELRRIAALWIQENQQ